MPIGRHLDRQVAARHLHHHGTGTAPGTNGHAGRRAARCARGQRIASTPLPDLDTQSVPVDDMGKLHVGSLWKKRQALDRRSHGHGQFGRDFVQKQHAVRVPDAGRCDDKVLAPDLDLLAYDLAFGAQSRDCRTEERKLPHVQGNSVSAGI